MAGSAESTRNSAALVQVAHSDAAGASGAHPQARSTLAGGGVYLDEGSGDRPILSTYSDPVDLIWVATARSLGITIRRSDTVFASWDGAGGLTLSTPAGFDPDDCVAQLVLHELCHALVEGPDAWALPDWGLENTDARDLSHEHAAQRLQGRLSAPHGLRGILAPTTKWRDYYDALPDDPLQGPDDDPAVPLAQAAWERARHPRWWVPLQKALVATAAIARATADFADEGALWKRVTPCW